MKRKFSKILGVGLTLALLASLLLTAAPVSAITTPSVTVDPTTISAVDADYTISFRITEQLDGENTTYTGESVGTTDGSGDLTGTLAITPVVAGSVILNDGTQTFTDNGSGVLVSSGAGSGTIVYTTGAFTITGGAATAAVTAIYDRANSDSIVVTFNDDTIVADPLAQTVEITAWVTDINGGNLTERTLVNAVAVVDVQEVTITWTDTYTITTLGTVVVEFTDGITNPDTTGDYNLTVATSQEAAATSADYELTVPDIGVLPGIVQQFNAADPIILMAQETGFDAINKMVDGAGPNYTIVVGPGNYAIDAPINLDQAGLTLKSSAGRDDTIIDASGVSGGNGIYIDAADVTVDGFTVEDAPATSMYLMDADDAIIQNNIVTFVDYYGIGIDISASATGVTVSGNEFNEYAIMGVNGSDATLSGNTFGECVNINGTLTGLTITGNIMVGSTGRAIDFIGGNFTDVLIDGNTISEAAPNAINIRAVTVTNLQILNNEITDNEGVGIQIADGATTTTGSAIAIKFNTITGNDADNDGYGIQNDDDDAIVDASFNWWGPDGASVGGTGTVTTSPVLADTAEAVFSATDLKVGADSLNGKDTVGVAVSVDTSTGAINTIVLAKYIANPQEAIADAIAFYDVYVAGTGTWDAADKATIKFYAGDANTEVYIWSADTLTWGEVTPVSYSAYGGYVWVTIDDPAMLAGTPFALVTPPVVAAVLDAPGIVMPAVGAVDVVLRPTFDWLPVAGADGYYFQLADNPLFAPPLLISFEGDLGRLLAVQTAYTYVPGLDEYATPYHWRVKAVSGTIGAGDLLESAWVENVFITMDEPVEVLPPVVVEETPDVVLEPADIIVTLPPATPITPSWIYVIIAVGAVLVIALLVLIVRTRRVA